MFWRCSEPATAPLPQTRNASESTARVEPRGTAGSCPDNSIDDGARSAPRRASRSSDPAANARRPRTISGSATGGHRDSEGRQERPGRGPRSDRTRHKGSAGSRASSARERHGAGGACQVPRRSGHPRREPAERNGSPRRCLRGTALSFDHRPGSTWELPRVPYRKASPRHTPSGTPCSRHRLADLHRADLHPSHRPGRKSPVSRRGTPGSSRGPVRSETRDQSDRRIRWLPDDAPRRRSARRASQGSQGHRRPSRGSDPPEPPLRRNPRVSTGRASIQKATDREEAGVLLDDGIGMVRTVIVDDEQLPLDPFRDAQFSHPCQGLAQQVGTVPGTDRNCDVHIILIK